MEKNNFSLGVYDSAYISEKERTVAGKLFLGFEKNDHSVALTGSAH